MSVTSLQVLKLYKELLKYGSNLKLTNKNYYQRRIKEEFKQNKLLSDPKEIQFSYDKGQELLKRKSIV
ncbi:MIEF1 upstream open reading frame protein [Adelges cooleyi]|uniref:MIEF1 upstream open reading frame protein n=1 Tax=Adelges cooleyi TaxID=133065 RepID=UPI0021805C23|nr:MIEF1 upstream open reading frame protein [Adelges cooleyi]XP_050431839.1 MIEF1 upstream open reading frame protein [Adelges cooleyi]